MSFSLNLRLIQSRSSLVVRSGASRSLSLRTCRYTGNWSPFVQTEESSKAKVQSDEAVFPLEYDAYLIAMQKKRKLELQKWKNKDSSNKKAKVPLNQLQGTFEDIIHFEVEALLEQYSSTRETPPPVSNNDVNSSQKLPTEESSSVEVGNEYDVEIVKLSSNGEGLAYSPSGDHIIVVPFAVPGDVVTAKVYKSFGTYSLSDYVKIVKPSQLREGVKPPCKYFSECAGCQFQMLPYAEQLKHKKTVVEDAFRHFSGLSANQIPGVLDTMGSPLQYGYRTKLTPHFNRPRKPTEGDDRSNLNKSDEQNIGFNAKGRSRVLDIEQCIIGTDILQEGLTVERAEIQKNMYKYKQGATLLLRESTVRLPKEDAAKDHQLTDSAKCDYDAEPISKELSVTASEKPELHVTYPTHIDQKTYVSDMSGYATEYIGPYKFTNRAGSFFQNNNSILRAFTGYVRDQVQPKRESENEGPEIRYLLDAYCGSGLFTITLSSMFSSALGIDVDVRGIEAARLNADTNNVNNAGFIAADASDLFADVPYPPNKSVVIIDPPRKGASEDFLRQLCQFGAKRVIYVSCNVHTQARDVGMIVRGFDDLPKSFRYKIESLKGFDFFPQTGHVEGVCVLSRADLVGASS